MKGICLGGGMGTRLAPLTRDDNKHLLPVYNARMIEYPIRTLVDAGIDEIVLITGGKRPGAFLELFRNGKDHGIKKLFYAYQTGNGGIAEALKLAEPFAADEPCVVILGDNYFEDGIKDQLSSWRNHKGCMGAGCIIQKTSTPQDFGIAEINEHGRVISLEEKPKHPKSDWAVLGCYFCDHNVWSILPSLVASARGELEITHVLESYLKTGDLEAYQYSGYWSDMGTFHNWMTVSERVASKYKESKSK
jgi:glucose-1-phosphate thymidylyltransferase